VALRVQYTDKMRTPPSPRLRFDLPDPLWQDRREVGGGVSALRHGRSRGRTLGRGGLWLRTGLCYLRSPPNPL